MYDLGHKMRETCCTHKEGNMMHCRLASSAVVANSTPMSTSHILAEPSLLPVTRRFPSPLYAMQVTTSECR